MKQKHKMKLWKKILILIAVLLLAAGVGCGVYLGDYYHAESSAIEAITDPENGVRVSRSDNGQIVFTPEKPPGRFHRDHHSGRMSRLFRMLRSSGRRRDS